MHKQKPLFRYKDSSLSAKSVKQEMMDALQGVVDSFGDSIDNYLEKSGEELTQNGYEVLVGKRLTEFKLVLRGRDDHETDFAIISISFNQMI